VSAMAHVKEVARPTFWGRLAKQDPFKGVPKSKWYVVDGKV